jgi:endonuclease III
MSSRADKFEQLYKSLKKHFKHTEGTVERSVLEHMLYACCLEDARVDQADEAFAKLQQTYFDWNEVRVTTAIELGEVLSSLSNPPAAGHRIKRCLQSLFESRYQYDIDDLKKANLGKATEELQAWQGMTPFILNYISQHALGGHAIPADTSILDALLAADIITSAEAEKKVVPGVERAIPKNKGLEFSSLLHQFAIEFAANPKSPAALAVFKDLGVTPKPKAAVVVPDSKATKKKLAAGKPETSQPRSQETTPVAKVGTKGSVVKDSSKPVAAKPEPQKGEVKPAPKSDAKTDIKSTKPEAGKKDAKSSVRPADAKPVADHKAKEIKADSGKTSEKKMPPSKTKGKEKPKSLGAIKKSGKQTASHKPTASKNKPNSSKSKISKGDKPVGKKPGSPTKKPAKMANNVKITKKKPK